VLDYFSTEPVVSARPLTYAIPDGPDTTRRTDDPQSARVSGRGVDGGSAKQEADEEAGAAGLAYEWLHPVGSVVSALIREGMVIRFLHEWPFTTWRPFKGLVPYGAGAWTWPGPGTLPLQYSMRADRPAG